MEVSYKQYYDYESKQLEYVALYDGNGKKLESVRYYENGKIKKIETF
jgi:antitoxin component YwqK of YwqJK toxin-antitoxin module